MSTWTTNSSRAQEAAEKPKDLVKMLSLGSFKFTNFISNDPKSLNQIEPDAENRSNDGKQLLKQDKSFHVLGLKWNHKSDTLVVSRGTTPDTQRSVTQRVVLSLSTAVYDPIGLVAPYTVKARLLLKDMSGQKWDDVLPDDIVTKFTDWSSKLGTLSGIVIPRSCFQRNVDRLELHMFGDSSQDVFSGVAFLRGKIVSEHGDSTELAFVFGKARVAPMKVLTISKLELQAALLSAWLRNGIQQALTLEIEKQPVFVANRVAEILALTTVDE